MPELQHALSVYGYVALLPLAVFEGPVVTVLAAMLAARGLLDVGAVAAIVIAGDLIGDMLLYVAGRRLLGRWRGDGAATGWRARLSRRVAAVGPAIRGHAGKVLLLGKLTHSAGFVVLLAAGAARVRPLVFLGYNVLGTVPKSLALVAVGYWFGRLYLSLGEELRVAGVVGFVGAATLLVLLARRLPTVHDGSGA
jgi:membrane protein DedA with SNARE-associated domain